MKYYKRYRIQRIKELLTRILSDVEDLDSQLTEESTIPESRKDVIDRNFEALCHRAFSLFCCQPERACISYLQRKLCISYGMAARIVEELETRGYIGGSRGPNRPRKILKSEWEG